MSADYNKLYYNAVNFVSVEDGVNPHFICPKCGFEWNPQHRVTTIPVPTFDLNKQLSFKRPLCGIIISLYVALHKDSRCKNIRIAVEPIPPSWWRRGPDD